MAKDLTVSYLLDFYGAALTDKQCDVMQQYYNADLSLAEIASNFGITRQGVRDAIKRGEATVRELEAKLGFAARYRALQQDVTQLESLVRNVRFVNEGSYARSTEIAQDTEEMLRTIEKISERF